MEEIIQDWVSKFNSMSKSQQKSALRVLLKTKRDWMDEKQATSASDFVKTLKPQEKTEKKTTPKPKEAHTSIFDKLTDPTLYTGSHKERFDEEGKGKGLAGRDSVPKGKGHIPPTVSMATKSPEVKKAAVVKKEVANDGFCKYAPQYGCSVTNCYLKCLHCNEGYCSACLWSDSGKMSALDKCARCGKKPRSLPSGQRPGFRFIFYE